MPHSHVGPTSRLATALLAISAAVFAAAIAAVVLVVIDPWPDHRTSATSAAGATPTVSRALVADRPEVRAAALLRAWDRRRSAAWAVGDEAALAALYVDRSPAARADRVMLRQWTRRGLRVAALRTQVLRVEVLDHRPDRWDLRVADRVAGGAVVSATAAGQAGASPLARLPSDSARVSRVVLVRASAGSPGSPWLVQETTDRPAISAERSAAPR